MNFKNNLEKDPNRCRQLRQTMRGIDGQLKATDARLTASRSEIKKLRDQRGRMKNKAKNLEIQIVGASVSSGASGPLGIAIGVSTSTLATQLEVLKSNIVAVQRKIDDGKEKIKRLKPHRDNLAKSFEKVSADLNALNCVV